MNKCLSLLLCFCLLLVCGCRPEADGDDSSDNPATTASVFTTAAPATTSATTTWTTLATSPTTIRSPLQSSDATLDVRMSDDSAADPFITYDGHTGYYYTLFTLGSRLELYRSKTLGDLIRNGERKVLYEASENAEITGNLWAPEMVFLDGKWYIYTSGSTPFTTWQKRLCVFESETADPFDGFHFKDYLSRTLFAIDPTVYRDEATGKTYICVSEADGCQKLAIAELLNPWTMGTPQLISTPFDYAWENLDPSNSPINEGAFFLQNAGRLFIVFSANGCFCDDYCLGLLEYTGGDMLSIGSWRKYEYPVFAKGNGVYAPGHASFFRSPDGSEVWVAYHGYYSENTPGEGRSRYCQVQKIGFDATGFPVFGEPLPPGTRIPVPSGE